MENMSWGWEGAEDVENMKEGGFLMKHNAYNWGYGIAYSRVEKRKYPGAKKCGYMKRECGPKTIVPRGTLLSVRSLEHAVWCHAMTMS